MAIEKVNKNDIKSRIKLHVSKDSISAAFLFCFLLILLHFLEPEYNPLKNLISEYELGKYGWMMSLAFISLGFGVLGMLVATSNKKFTKRGFVSRIIFYIVFIGLIGAGIFYPDTTKNLESSIHTTCGMIVIIGFPIAVFYYRKDLIMNAENKVNSRKCINLATIFVFIGFISFMGSIIVLTIISGSKENLNIGLQNRFMMLTYSMWIIAASWDVATTKSR